MRAVLAGCITPIPELQNEHGRLSVGHLCVGRSAFKEALDKGLRWLILHWQCQTVWPKLGQFVQQALNTEARGVQTEIEVMLSMHEGYSQAVQSNEEPDWDGIQKAACFSLPPCATYADALASYVKMNAGGLQGTLLHELSLFQKKFAASEKGPLKALGSEFFKKLCSLNFGPALRFPFLLNACIEANLCSPPNKVVDGYCKLLSASSLSALTAAKNRAKVVEAEQLMADIRALADKLSVPETLKVTSVGRADVRLVLFLCKKGKDGEGVEYASIADIAEAICL